MLDDMEKIVNSVLRKEKELHAVKDKLLKYDDKRLKEVIDTAMGGMNFSPIWSEKRYIKEDQGETSPTHYLYFDDKYNTILKGVKVSEHRGELYTSNIYNEDEDLHELWLTPRSFLSTRMTGRSEKSNWGKTVLTRVIVNKEADPLELNIDGRYMWDVECIINSVFENLRTKTYNLNKEIVEQSERLKKIESVRIK